MKNAYVLDDHHGDDGTVAVGMILLDVATKRYDELERKGLVREATAQEVKDGYKPPFQPEEKEATKPDNKQAPAPPNKQAPAPATKAA